MSRTLLSSVVTSNLPEDDDIIDDDQTARADNRTIVAKDIFSSDVSGGSGEGDGGGNSMGTSCAKPRPSLDGAGGKRRSIVEINVQLYEEEILKRQNSFKNLSPQTSPTLTTVKKKKSWQSNIYERGHKEDGDGEGVGEIGEMDLKGGNHDGEDKDEKRNEVVGEGHHQHRQRRPRKMEQRKAKAGVVHHQLRDPKQKKK